MKGKRFLVLEDDPELRELYGMILYFLAGEITLTSSCTDALAVAGPFDVAVLDLELPDGSGADVARVLQARCPRMRVLIVTASPDQVPPGLAVLPKPFKPSELVAAIQELTPGQDRTSGKGS